MTIAIIMEYQKNMQICMNIFVGLFGSTDLVDLEHGHLYFASGSIKLAISCHQTYLYAYGITIDLIIIVESMRITKGLHPRPV